MGLDLKKILKKEKMEVFTGKPIDVLIDGDILAYRASAATDGKYYSIHGEKVKYHKEAIALADKLGVPHLDIIVGYSPEPEKNALHNLDKSVKRVLEDIEEEYKRPACPCVFLTGKSNFRSVVLSTYKSSRKVVKKPTHLKACKDQLLGKWDGLLVEGYEADDLICIDSYARSHRDCVVASLDKDLLQIPGLHYNWSTRTHSKITEEEATYLFWIQVLMGDKTDDIPGIKGIGPKKAEKILKDYRAIGATPYEYYTRVKAEYIGANPMEEKELPPEYLGRVCRLLKMNASLLHLLKDFDVFWQFPLKSKDVTSDTVREDVKDLLKRVEYSTDRKGVRSYLEAYLRVRHSILEDPTFIASSLKEARLLESKSILEEEVEMAEKAVVKSLREETTEMYKIKLDFLESLKASRGSDWNSFT